MKPRLLPLVFVPLVALAGCSKSIEQIHEEETKRYPAAIEKMWEQGVTVELDAALEICDKRREGMNAGEIAREMAPDDSLEMSKVTAAVLAEMCEIPT